MSPRYWTLLDLKEEIPKLADDDLVGIILTESFSFCHFSDFTASQNYRNF